MGATLKRLLKNRLLCSSHLEDRVVAPPGHDVVLAEVLEAVQVAALPLGLNVGQQPPGGVVDHLERGFSKGISAGVPTNAGVTTGF